MPDAEGGDRTGYQGKRYRTIRLGSMSFGDCFDDFLAFLEPRLVEVRRLLTADGSLFVHLDYREVHYCKVLLDGIFGRDGFVNEIIWAYDYGAGARGSAGRPSTTTSSGTPATRSATSSTTTRSTASPTWRPSLVGAEKARRGKTPTDTWWQTIVSPTGREKTGYPTQKPLAILERIVKVHSDPGDTVLDLLRRQRHARRGRRAPRPPLPAGGRQPRGAGGHGQRLAFAAPELVGWPRN